MGAFAANQRVRLGVIGVGNRGDQLIDAFMVHPDAQITAICDVYQPYIEFAKQKVGDHPFVTKDYRRILDRKDIDAVLIATPDHWHALQFIDACAAGKDVFVEKPLSLVIAEGRKMVRAAERYNRITQMGVHRRSLSICRRVVELIQKGAIGRVTSCRCFHLTNEYPMGIGNPPDSDPPKGLDWDMWLGPAPKVPYNENRCLYKFRWFREYSGGQMTNFGTHYLDMIQWAIGQDAPIEVTAVGSSLGLEDNRRIPVNMQAIWKYPDGILATYSQFNANAASGDAMRAEIEFRGTKGTLHYGRGKIEIVPEKIRLEPVPAKSPLYRKENGRQARATQRVIKPLTETGKTDTADHARNFLDAVKTRKPCTCPVEVGHRSTSTTLLANIAYDRKRSLTWDPKREQVTNDPEANKLLFYQYRSPWKLS
jgi:predicted dehydrogenase